MKFDKAHDKWTPERIKRLNQRNRAFRPVVGSLWHDEEGYPFRWNGSVFKPEDHRYAPTGSMTLDMQDPFSLGGLVKRVSEIYGPRAYQEREADGVWRAYASGIYERSKQIGEGDTRVDALFSAMRSLGSFVMNGAPDELLPRRKRARTYEVEER